MATQSLSLKLSDEVKDLSDELSLVVDTRYVVQINGGTLFYSEVAAKPVKTSIAHALKPSSNPFDLLTLKIDATNKPWVWAGGSPVTVIVTEAA